MDTFCYLCGHDDVDRGICRDCGYAHDSLEEVEEELSLDQMLLRTELRVQRSRDTLEEVEFEKRPEGTVPSVEELINVRGEE